MLAAFVFALLAGDVRPPLILPPDPALRGERMDLVRALDLRNARIFVAQGDGRAREMTGDVREEFLGLLEHEESYSDIPGVMGCIAKQYVVTVVFHDRARESWFCVGCQRIIPMWKSDGAVDAVLSEAGAAAIERVLARAVHPKKKRPAEAGRCR